jgi:hypothetical protein
MIFLVVAVIVAAATEYYGRLEIHFKTCTSKKGTFVKDLFASIFVWLLSV